MKLFRSASGPPGPSRESARLPMKRTSGMRRWPAVSLIVTLPVLALGACTGTSQRSSAVPEVRIGLLGAMSGSASGTGQAAARGAQLAALVINPAQSLPVPLAAAAGLPGLDGAKIRIVQADTGSDPDKATAEADRKSTRLNSSHEWISYAVFCLKKKKKITNELSIYKKKIIEYTKIN